MKASDIRKSTIDQLLTEYANAAFSHRASSRKGEYKKSNSAYRRIVAVVRELRSRGPEVHESILRLLDDPRVEVRGWAAVHALEVSPERAEKVLEEIASGPKSLEEFGASMSLREWRAGRLTFP